MRTAVVALYHVFPPTCGAARGTYLLARHLKGAVRLIQLTNTPPEVDFSGDFSLVSCRLHHGGRLAKALGILGSFSAIEAGIKEFHPDVVILEGASWAVYYALLLRRLRRTLGGVDLVYHAHNVESLLRRQKEGRTISLLTRWAEGWVVRRADIVTAVSAIDQAQFESLYGVKPWILPNGVDARGFLDVSSEEVSAIRKKYGLNGICCLFMGLLGYRPNDEAIDFLFKIFPDIWSRAPEAKLVIIGGILSRNAPWLINPGIIPYEEIPAFVKACDVGLAPIFSGSGTRLKILEYMAAGLPAVATPKGAEGLEVQGDDNIVLAESEESFRRRTLEILGSAARRQAIGRSAQALIASQYGWEILVPEFSAAVERFQENRRRY